MSTLSKKLNPIYSSSIAFSRKKQALTIFKRPFILNIIVFSLILIFLTFYLIKINQLVVLGFRLGELEKNLEELKKTNKNLETERTGSESLANTQIELSLLNFVKTDKLEYLKSMGGLALTRK